MRTGSFGTTPSRRRALTAGLALALMLSPGCARRVNVSGASMEPTVPAGGHIWVSTIVGTIERGDIVVMRSAEGRDHLRRVVVLPGEVVDIVDGRVRIGGTPLDEPYVLPARRSHERYGPYTVPAGQYFLMGDNRAASLDSRHQGAIPRSQIWARRTW